MDNITGWSMVKGSALVIGNAEYQFVNSLRNPINDASAVTEILSRLGFDVIQACNLDQRNFNQSIDLFGRKITKESINIFYYAGHGIQYDGINYLVPSDATVEYETQIEAYCISLNRILKIFESFSTGPNIIILDACRNNPFERLRGSLSCGLAHVSAPLNMLIAYSTSPGSTSHDGIGSNSLYTEALVSQIGIHNIHAEEMFKRIRIIVYEKSEHKQLPWENTSLIENVYLNGYIKHVSVELINIVNHCNSINSKMYLLEQAQFDVGGESTDGADLKIYFDNDGKVQKIEIKHFGESGQAFSEYFYKNENLCFYNVCHIKYNRPYYWDMTLADEVGDNEIFDFAKSSFSTTKIYFKENKVLSAFDNDDNEIQSISDDMINDIMESSARYISYYRR